MFSHKKRRGSPRLNYLWFVTVILKNGVPVRGQILATDKFTVLMMAHGKQQSVYKQAISTIIK
ncbi:RNA-binding protein Hfq [Bacillus cereus]|nr:RNA-binding protein Hfq [Bacillus cereus]PGU50728.1 RNA-binding protein Hfq [Bacillus cereus]